MPILASEALQHENEHTPGFIIVAVFFFLIIAMEFLKKFLWQLKHLK